MINIHRQKVGLRKLAGDTSLEVAIFSTKFSSFPYPMRKRCQKDVFLTSETQFFYSTLQSTSFFLSKCQKKDAEKQKFSSQKIRPTQDNSKPFIGIECNKLIIYFSQLFDLLVSRIN
jgi:hypothetical protein